tara:strand:- start:518 stop:1525 length:1008 start_codon:yes stop_codon:yes gene_type:complete
MKEKEELIKNCIEKFNTKNHVKHSDYNLPIDEFLMVLYKSCDPQCYGTQFPKKLLKDGENDLNLFEMPDKIDDGDVGLIYPTYDSWFGGGRHVATPDGNQDIKTYKKITFEAKLSFLHKNGSYGIRQIRLYQDFNFFLICFVDCEDNFTPSFTCINQQDIKNICHLTPTNGTKEANKKNGNIPYSLNVTKGSYQMKLLFDEYNLLRGTTYNDVLNFLSKKNIEVMMEVFNEMPYNIKELVQLNGSRIKKIYKFIHDINIDENYISWCMKRKYAKKGNKGHWDKKRCLEESKKYSNRTDFYKGSKSAYNVCSKNGWLPEICEHMGPKLTGYSIKDK